MPIVLGALVADAGVWALLPDMGRRKWRDHGLMEEEEEEKGKEGRKTNEQQPGA